MGDESKEKPTNCSASKSPEAPVLPVIDSPHLRNTHWSDERHSSKRCSNRLVLRDAEIRPRDICLFYSVYCVNVKTRRAPGTMTITPGPGPLYWVNHTRSHAYSPCLYWGGRKERAHPLLWVTVNCSSFTFIHETAFTYISISCPCCQVALATSWLHMSSYDWLGCNVNISFGQGMTLWSPCWPHKTKNIM